MLVFLTGEHSNNKKVPISVHYFSSSRSMPNFISVEKVVLLVCIKSALICHLLLEQQIKHLLIRYRISQYLDNTKRDSVYISFLLILEFRRDRSVADVADPKIDH